jgi:hypothetical protein
MPSEPLHPPNVAQFLSAAAADDLGKLSSSD